MLVFELSMPGCPLWNGRWSGEDRYYAVVRRASKGREAEIATQGYFSYAWSGGWRAGVAVRAIDSREAAKVRRKSRGFCGHDWMVDSILRHGAIVSLVSPEAARPKEGA